jgi:hypothetical protein
MKFYYATVQKGIVTVKLKIINNIQKQTRNNVLMRMFYVKRTAKHKDENIISHISLTLISNLQICNYLKKNPKTHL